MNTSQTPTSVLAEFNSLKPQIGRWAKENFDVERPELGIAEEAGELTHAVLKREQGIRSAANKKTMAEITDALGDAMIYMLHFAHLHQIPIGFSRVLALPDSEFAYLGLMHRASGNLILNLHTYGANHHILTVEWCLLFTTLWELSRLYELNLLTVTRETWEVVSKRNWRKHKHDGTTK